LRQCRAERVIAFDVKQHIIIALGKAKALCSEYGVLAQPFPTAPNSPIPITWATYLELVYNPNECLVWFRIRHADLLPRLMELWLTSPWPTSYFISTFQPGPYSCIIPGPHAAAWTLSFTFIATPPSTRSSARSFDTQNFAFMSADRTVKHQQRNTTKQGGYLQRRTPGFRG